ncbi:hypothetical protein MNBD_BACTEROID03-1020 [hydrothermal vent metagenome]|uniref:Secretion system C-terminal sorting domain-containing protein n=1 Tax=hydrothermal vent metagenome TaxID=652676 RepID=A0A3B0TJB0_9ZZZZ
MKKCYFGLLLLLSLSAYGQEMPNNDTSSTKAQSTLKLYPNPAINDVVYITTTNNATKEIVVYDVFGKIVLTDRIFDKSLNVSKLVAGVYILQVIEGSETMTRKLVVK